LSFGTGRVSTQKKSGASHTYNKDILDKEAKIGLDHWLKAAVSPRRSHPIGEAERRNQKLAGTMTFEQFFTNATCDSARPERTAPYDYQCRLACGAGPDRDSRRARFLGFPPSVFSS
jgi:hypothetical protein